MGWSGLEWGEVDQNGVEWIEVGWSGLEWGEVEIRRESVTNEPLFSGTRLPGILVRYPLVTLYQGVNLHLGVIKFSKSLSIQGLYNIQGSLSAHASSAKFTQCMYYEYCKLNP